MTLISALLGIAADRLWTHLHEYRQYDRFLRYVDWMRARFNGATWDHIGGLLVILLPVWLLVALLQVWIDDWLFGLVDLLFYLAVFVYCLGPRDLASDVDTWCEVSDSSDSTLRQRAAGRLLRGEQAPENSPDCARHMSNAVLVESADRVFAVLFWFVLLGPLGAVMYRSAAVLYFQRPEQGTFAESVAWLYAALLWLPARLLALGFALSGHFDSALEGWRQAHQDQPRGATGSERVLSLTGGAALGLDDEAFADASAPVRAAMRMVWRTLTLWLVILSLLVLAGWVG
jgi:membrane protein required for beta-lactamase induction